MSRSENSHTFLPPIVATYHDVQDRAMMTDCTYHRHDEKNAMNSETRYLSQRAIWYNTEACREFNQRNFVAAIELFTEALRAWKQGLHIHAGNQQTMLKEKKKLISRQVNIDQFMERFDIIESWTPESRDDDVVVAVAAYSRPIQVDLNEILTEDWDDDSLEQSCFSTIILFNTALSCHLLAVETQREDLFLRAIRFYRCAYQIEEARCHSEEEFVVSKLLLLSIFNNMGHISLIMNDMVSAEGYFLQVLSTITLIVEFGILDQNECAKFSENAVMVLVSLRNNAVSCASAA